MQREKRVARVISIFRIFLARVRHLSPLRYTAFLLCLILALSVQAQSEPPRLIVENITVSAGETPGMVSLQGAAGSVPSRTDIFAQNLFTGETVTGKANSAGTFTLDIAGTEFTPFALNAVLVATPEQRENPETLPGDTGVIVWSQLPTSANGHTAFAAGGRLAYGAAAWWGEGDVSTRFNTGDLLDLTLDVVLATANQDTALDLRVRGHLALERIADENGQPIATQPDLSNGWTTRQTRAGLPVLSAELPVELGLSEASNTTRADDTLSATLNFASPLPADLPAGLYIPIFRGDIQVSDSEWEDWYTSRLLSTLGTGAEGNSTTRLPVVLQIGTVTPPHMLWSLFQAVSSDGTTGLLPVGIQNSLLVNQRHYTPSLLVLPPGNYPLEPYLPALFAQNESYLGVPRVPLALPGGEYTVTITQPNAGVDRIAPQAFRQITFENAPDLPPMARLTTLDPLLTNYPFTMYGVYDLTTSGTVQDISGQRYTSGGAYRVLIAELLDITPVSPLGMPFQEGDSFHAGLRLAPAMPAEVSVIVRYYPLGQDKPIVFNATGQANTAGYFMPDESFIFEGAGEYVVDYEARYTDAEGRLWASSIRGAGVVSSLDSKLIAHGQRGLLGYERSPLAWFDTTVYPVDAPALVPRPYWPYHSGDLVLLPNRAETGLFPMLTVQDTQGDYATWLQQQDQDAADSIMQAAHLDSLPTPYTAQSYAYLSAVTPSLTLRQFVQSDAEVSDLWSMTESLGGQIGGASLRTGDTILLYGGVVTPDDTAGYAAVGLVTDDESNVEVVPPFTRPVAIDDDDTNIWLDVWSLALTPGQQMNVGETINLAGQVIPPLPAQINIMLTSTTGDVRTFETHANATGYFYSPQNNFVASEPGVWQIMMDVSFAGRTSAGMVERPYTGRRTFDVYVTSDASPLTSDPLTETLQSPGQAMQIDLSVPDGWTEVEAVFTARTDSVLLNSDTLLVQTGRARYVYARLELARQTTTLETDGTGDVVYLSFLLTGRDASGQPVARGRTYTVVDGVLRANPE